MSEKKFRTIRELMADQHQIDKELKAYYAELIARAKAKNSGNGDAAKDIVENDLKNARFTSDEWKHWWNQYNEMMKAD